MQLDREVKSFTSQRWNKEKETFTRTPICGMQGSNERLRFGKSFNFVVRVPVHAFDCCPNVVFRDGSLLHAFRLTNRTLDKGTTALFRDYSLHIETVPTGVLLSAVQLAATIQCTSL